MWEDYKYSNVFKCYVKTLCSTEGKTVDNFNLGTLEVIKIDYSKDVPNIMIFNNRDNCYIVTPITQCIFHP